MTISLVVAAGEDHSIGKDNGLLWKLPDDMKFFKNLTWAMPVIMGRKTFESMGSKPLPGRINIVISRNTDRLSNPPLLQYCSSLDEAIQLAKKTNCKEAFIIGGGDIYKQSMANADCIYMTRVEACFPDADTFFSPFSETDFEMIEVREHSADEKHAYAFRFETWRRKV